MSLSEKKVPAPLLLRASRGGSSPETMKSAQLFPPEVRPIPCTVWLFKINQALFASVNSFAHSSTQMQMQKKQKKLINMIKCKKKKLLHDLSLYGLNTLSGHDVEMTSAHLCTESLPDETEFNDSTDCSAPNHLFPASSFGWNVIMQHRSQSNLSKMDREMIYLLEGNSQKIVDYSLKRPTVQQNGEQKEW